MAAMRFDPRCLLLVLMFLTSAAVPAADGRAGERERIQAERREADRRFQEARRECEQRFAVTPCLEEARGDRRRVLDRLAREQAVLDDAQRRQRAAERLRGIQDKARQADDQAMAPVPVRRVQRTQPLAPRPRASGPGPDAMPLQDPVAAQRQAEQQRQDYERRQQEARDHRQALQQRNAARDAKKPPAAPLPIPSAPGSGKR
jgi:hypothetical protein